MENTARARALFVDQVQKTLHVWQALVQMAQSEAANMEQERFYQREAQALKDIDAACDAIRENPGLEQPELRLDACSKVVRLNGQWAFRQDGQPVRALTAQESRLATVAHRFHEKTVNADGPLQGCVSLAHLVNRHIDVWRNLLHKAATHAHLAKDRAYYQREIHLLDTIIGQSTTLLQQDLGASFDAPVYIVTRPAKSGQKVELQFVHLSENEKLRCFELDRDHAPKWILLDRHHRLVRTLSPLESQLAQCLFDAAKPELKRLAAEQKAEPSSPKKTLDESRTLKAIEDVFEGFAPDAIDGRLSAAELLGQLRKAVPALVSDLIKERNDLARALERAQADSRKAQAPEHTDDSPSL